MNFSIAIFELTSHRSFKMFSYDLELDTTTKFSHVFILFISTICSYISDLLRLIASRFKLTRTRTLIRYKLSFKFVCNKVIIIT